MLRFKDSEFMAKSGPGAEVDEDLTKSLAALDDVIEKSVKSPAERQTAEDEMSKAKAGADGYYDVKMEHGGKEYTVKMDAATHKDYKQHLDNPQLGAGGQYSGQQDMSEDEKKKGKGTKKSIMAEFDLGEDFEGADLIKSIDDVLGDEIYNEGSEGSDLEFEDATPMIKGLGKMLGQNSQILDEKIEALNGRIDLVVKSISALVKQATDNQAALSKIGDQGATRGPVSQGAALPVLSDDQMAKAKQLENQTWETFMKAADLAADKGIITGRDLSLCDDYRRKGASLYLLQAERGDVANKIGPLCKEVA